MTAIDLGQTVTVSWTASTSSTTVLTVTRPDGTTATPVVGGTAPTYTAPVPTPQAGRYLLKWSQAATADVYTDVLNVWPADPRFLISVDELVTAIRQTTTVSAADRSDMRLVIAAATEVVEDVVGAVLVRTETQTADGGKTGVALWERPTAITSVVEDGTTLTANVDYVAATNAAIIYAGSSTAPRSFAYGRQNIVITYTTGTTSIAANIRLAAIELCRHMWAITRQTNVRAQLPGDYPDEDMTTTPSGFLIPRRVMQLLVPDSRKDGLG